MSEVFDYIVIGAGSAGCVVASRLSEDPSVRVLLLEAGPKPSTPWIKIPAGVSRLIFPGKYNWGYSTEPQPNLNNRSIYAPRGKTLGGTSAINGMLYVRGHREDYDGWRQLGNKGWSWADILPYFKKFENFEGGANEHHGGDGELSVTSPRVKHRSSKDFIETGVRLGLPLRDDLNGAEQEGVGFLYFSINNGQRASTAEAFLKKAMHRPNLTVETEAVVCKIDTTGRRATSVSYRKGGQTVAASADREIILSAGSIDSPKLLMLSGIGAGAKLREHGIDVVHDLPGVGENLQDHLYAHSTFRTTPDSSVNADLRGLRKYVHGAFYVMTRRGLLTLASSQACAFVRVLPGASRPDLQVVFRPMSWDFTPQGTLEIGAFPAFGLSTCQLRPFSRGRIELRSPRFDDSARIFANYLDDPTDRDAAVAGLKWMRRLSETEPLKSRVVSAMAPPAGALSDEELLAYARDTMQSVHHWAGSCKMGPDPMAVVDDELRVHGVSGLRVVDASIMPIISSGNTNAPTIMIGEKAAAMIKTAAKSNSTSN